MHGQQLHCPNINCGNLDVKSPVMVALKVTWLACNLTRDRVNGIETPARMSSIEFDRSRICLYAIAKTKSLPKIDFHFALIFLSSLVSWAVMYMCHAGEEARILRQKQMQWQRHLRHLPVQLTRCSKNHVLSSRSSCRRCRSQFCL